jgi:hypothetical protein
MNKGMFRNFNGILTHLIPLYEKTDNLLLSDFFLTWNDLVSPNKENVRLAQKHNIPAIIIEHGMKAVSDYEKGLKDTSLNMGGCKLIADHIMTWGDKSKEIMIESGASPDKVTTVGSPIIFDYQYNYISLDGEKKKVPFNAGLKVIDPETKNEWTLVDGERSLPTSDKNGNLILFMPYHDWTKKGIEKTTLIWEKIKHIPNIFVAASSAYQNELPENPFLELLKEKNYNKRIQKIITSDIRKPTNVDLVKNLFKRAKLVITAIPGTVNGIAWAMDVPTLVPEIEWGWVKNGKRILDIWPADYSCKLDNIDRKVEDILKDDTKEKDRLHYAKYFMGIDKGNPIENMKKCIDNQLKIKGKK